MCVGAAKIIFLSWQAVVNCKRCQSAAAARTAAAAFFNPKERLMQTMKAIIFDKPGDAEQLHLTDLPMPQAGPGELLVCIHATALNRADILQRQGKYRAPATDSALLGLEMAGTVYEGGEGVQDFRPGDRVCALLPGGGYAQYCTIPAAMALRLPNSLSFTRAAAIPEAFLTAHQALHWLAGVKSGEKILIHAGASGVGQAALQLARRAGASLVVATASAAKHAACRAAGAAVVIDYAAGDWEAMAMQAGADTGYDIIIDFIGGPYFNQNLSLLADDGRLVMLGFLGGSRIAEADLGPILRKRLQIVGSTLRNRSQAYKQALTDDFRHRHWDAFARGELEAVVDSIYDWEEVAAAHRYMEGNYNQGKIVLSVG